MGLKAINSLTKAVAKTKAPYLAPKFDMQTLKSLEFKLEQVVGDTLTISHSPKIAGKPLDRMSKECNFFGVDSWGNLITKLENHRQLSIVKSSWRVEGRQGRIVSMPPISLDDPSGFKIGKENLYQSFSPQTESSGNFINELNRQKTGKITFYSKEFFGITPIGNMAHTVGLVSNHDNLLVIDSLGEGTIQQKNFHKKIKELFADAGYKNIIFSTKTQQPIDDLTCNNWSYANIESVINYIVKNNDVKINSSNELNKLLKEDINEILREQMNVVICH